MAIKREDLARCLAQIKPTLGEKTMIEQLKCFWFDDRRKRAWTYNEVVATEAPFEFGISGGIGVAFAGIMENSSAAEIALSVKENELHFKGGSSIGKMSIRGMDEAIYPFPDNDAERDAIVQLTGDAAAALRHVNANAAESGVWLIVEGKELSFYSHNNKTISWAHIPLPDGYNAPRLLLSPQFCERMQVAMEGVDAILDILDTSVLATFNSNVRIFGRITKEEHPRMFRDAIVANAPDNTFIEAPPGIGDAVKRVCVLVQPGKPAKMHVTLAGADIRFEFKSDYGQLDEHFKVKGNKRTVDAYFDPEVLHNGFAITPPSTISIGTGAFAIKTEKGFGHIVQASKPD